MLHVDDETSGAQLGQAQPPTPLAVHRAWLFDPGSQWRLHGLATHDLVVLPGVLYLQPRPLARALVAAPQVLYDAPAVVIEDVYWSVKWRLRRMTGLHLDVEGMLGRAVTPGADLEGSVRAAGFDVVRITRRGWGEVPHPVTREEAAGYENRLPAAVFKDRFGLPPAPRH